MNQIETVESVVKETNAIVPVADGIRAALVRDLGPVADRLARYEGADLVPVPNKQDADGAAVLCEQIAQDIKAVKGHEVLSKITAGLHVCSPSLLSLLHYPSPCLPSPRRPRPLARCDPGPDQLHTSLLMSSCTRHRRRRLYPARHYHRLPHRYRQFPHYRW